MSELALVWAGMLIGISFLATPAKFLAPSLALPVALDVGRLTFGLFSLVEIVFAFLLLATALITRHEWGILIAAPLIGVLAALEVLSLGAIAWFAHAAGVRQSPEVSACVR
jgi:hypothetical protein